MADRIDSTIEFEVKDLSEEKFQILKDSLSGLSGVTGIDHDLNYNKVYVDTSLPSVLIHKQIENSTNLDAVLKGMGSIESAVAEMCTVDNKPCGLIRLVQINEHSCAIDGTVDGLEAGEHALNVFEYGDLSDGFNRLGRPFDPKTKSKGLGTEAERVVGELGNVVADETGQAQFRFIDSVLKTWDVIGRTICVSEKPYTRKNNIQNKILACGIIARSAVMQQNKKKVCGCDGKTMWEERSSAKRAQI